MKTVYEATMHARLSARYHDRRRAFYGRLSKVVQFVTILSGSGTASTALLSAPTGLVLFLGAVVSASSAAELVFGWGDKSYTHSSLFRRWVEVEQALVGLDDEATAPAEVERAMIAIECDEPPTMNGVVAICQNELSRSSGHLDAIKPIPWHRRVFAHFFQFHTA